MYNSVHCRLDTYFDRLIDGSPVTACPESDSITAPFAESHVPVYAAPGV
ncbi:MAG: hypothetical protein IPN72_08760 [Saprospiraceae bacterium]|nr:hypothetical protein [Saprospiraceae bacterium]